MGDFILFSWNINYSSRTIDEYECFDWDHRKENIFNDLKRNMSESTIYCIQEVYDGSKKDVLDFFQDNDFVCFIQQTHPVGRYIVTAIHKTHNCVRDYNLKQLPDNRLSYMSVVINKDIAVVNMHLPMKAEFRLAQSKQVAKYVSTLDIGSITTGDMNTFPDGRGHHQILEFQRISGGADVSSLILSEATDQRRVLKTFSPYPCDKVPKVIPYNLDHILVTGSNIKCETPTCGDDSLTIIFDDKMYHTSDHFYLKMKFKIV